MNKQPFLRWAGSKRQIVRTLARHWEPGYSRYVEPFAGSACLFFHLGAPRALLSDINGELILTYRQIKRDPIGVHKALAKLRHGKRAYTRVRRTEPATLSSDSRAARFIYLNRYCFNGLYRTNRDGQFNVPYGGSKNGRLPTLSHLEECSNQLQNTRLLAGDFGKALQEVTSGDFVYLDPPYAVGRRRVFKEYSAGSFGADDLVRLRTWLQRLAKKGIPFLVSYAMSEEALFLQHGFHSEVVHVRRSIAGFAGSRRVAPELLIFNQP